MDDLNEYIECPLMGKKIEDGICFDISMYAEEIAPARTVPNEVLQIENCRKKCLECKYHRYD